MKKSFSSNKTRKKNRGVAVIFTLGILGLLTVMALGFASTALLNRKLADNTSSAEYARHIAKNIALARAQWIVKNNLIADSIYSSGTVSGESASEDFLHKMDTVLADVDLYRATNDTGTIAVQPGTARWQYVKDADGKLLGRYAFAIVPDSGHLDPVGNRGQTSLAGRYGLSEKEIGVYSLCNGATGLDQNAAAAAGIKFRTFKEFAAAFSALSTANKKNLLKDGYRIQQAPTPDAFWLDIGTQDGKKTQDELYLRFNMPTIPADWESMTVDTLIGAGASDADADIKYSSTSTKNSVDFIPWLKYWTHSNGSSWTADIMKKQIAANIIQYNLPGPDDPSSPHKTISDKMGDSDDWLTAPPTYAGIGRHPMLNEIGFLFRVKAVVTHSPPTDNGDGTITCTYTPTYYITFDAGAELIYPFGPTSGLKRSRIWFPDIEIQFVLRKFLTSGKTPDPQTTVNNLGNNLIVGGILNAQMLHSDLDRIKITIPGSQNTVTSFQKLIETSTVIEPMTGEGYSWTNLALTQTAADWNTSPAYTKAASFWKADKTGTEQTLKMQIRKISITTKTTVGTTDQIAAAMARRMTIEWDTPFKTPATVVLRYGDNDSEEKQRDVAKLEQKTIPAGFATGEKTMTDMSPEKVWFVTYEAKDPLVNHYAQDWTVKQEGPKELDEGKLTTAGFYPGTLLDSDSHETGTSHLNSTVKDSGSPVALLKDNEMKDDGSALEEVVLESATDPAFSSSSRLSSSYIRHAPMRSLWELGFISRAEAFKTLNLGRTRIFNAGTAYNARGGGTFAQGDANLLDQIKFSDTADSKDAQGKINVNARYHKVFEWVFNQDAATSTGTTVNWYQNLISGDATDPYSTTPVAGTTQNIVCNGSSTCLSEQHSDIGDCQNCLAHLLMERSRILPFGNRADLLLDPDYPNATSPDITRIPGYSALSSADKTKLKNLQRKVRKYLLNPGNADTNEAKSKLVREQYAARFMNLLKADSEEHVYIIVLAQSLKDLGGVPAFVDWDGNGEYTPADGTAPTCLAAANFLKTGFVRKKLDGTNAYEIVNPSSGSAPPLNETMTTTTAGTYDYGADKITGETKLIAEMTKDKNTGKWKLTGLRYVE